MDMQHLAFVFAVAVGIVSSGLIASGWKLATGEDVRLGDLVDPDPGLLTPLRALAAVFAAPFTILVDAFWWMIAAPFVGVPLLAAALVWSFLQGVFILTQVFGFA
jgi:hypothetical protein